MPQNLSNDTTLSYLLQKTKTAVLDIVDGLLKKRVAKAGDTMTGNLYISGSNNGARIRRTGKTSGETTSANANGIGFRVGDKNDNIIAIITDYYTSDNRQGAWIAGAREVDGSRVYNSLNLYVDSEGTRTVTSNCAGAWRSMLGLGTTTVALPITNGGTGMTGTSSAVTTDVATAATNFQITSASYRSWGKMAMINVVVKATAAVAAGSRLTFTITSGKRPAMILSTVTNEGDRAYIDTAGGVYTYHAVSANSTFAIRTTYLLP